MSRVLVVEDDPDISRALTIRLEAAGYDVAHAYDAVLAMDAARKFDPQLVILDVMMPGGSGLDIAQRMQEVDETREIPFLFLTASRDPRLRASAEAMGAAGFFEKPFESAEILSTIGQVIQRTG